MSSARPAGSAKQQQPLSLAADAIDRFGQLEEKCVEYLLEIKELEALKKEFRQAAASHPAFQSAVIEGKTHKLLIGECALELRLTPAARKKAFALLKRTLSDEQLWAAFSIANETVRRHLGEEKLEELGTRARTGYRKLTAVRKAA